jgi:hypothetical protein
MMPTIDIDTTTYDAIDLAARLTSKSHGEVVTWLVKQNQLIPDHKSNDANPDGDAIKVYADYDGHRTHATFNRVTTRIDVTDGPLAGQHFKSPSSAARAVVAHYRPSVSPHRNGWSFWIVDETDQFLQSVRHAR